MGQKSALVLGCSGLVGAEVLKLCLESDTYNKVVTPVRRPLLINHEKRIEKVIDFDMPPWEEMFPVDHILCCLGTTIKKAGSKMNFRKVDHDYPLAFAAAAKKWRTTVFSVITATGSNANSNIFYNGVKGELETNLKSLAFDNHRRRRVFTSPVEIRPDQTFRLAFPPSRSKTRVFLINYIESNDV